MHNRHKPFPDEIFVDPIDINTVAGAKQFVDKLKTVSDSYHQTFIKAYQSIKDPASTDLTKAAGKCGWPNVNFVNLLQRFGLTFEILKNAVNTRVEGAVISRSYFFIEMEQYIGTLGRKRQRDEKQNAEEEGEHETNNSANIPRRKRPRRQKADQNASDEVINGIKEAVDKLVGKMEEMSEQMIQLQCQFLTLQRQIAPQIIHPQQQPLHLQQPLQMAPLRRQQQPLQMPPLQQQLQQQRQPVRQQHVHNLQIFEQFRTFQEQERLRQRGQELRQQLAQQQLQQQQAQLQPQQAQPQAQAQPQQAQNEDFNDPAAWTALTAFFPSTPDAQLPEPKTPDKQDSPPAPSSKN